METSKTVTPLSVGLKEAAEMIGLAPRTLRKYSSTGRVRSIKLGNRLLFRVADLEQLLTENERPAKERRPRSGSAGKEVAKALAQVSAAMRGPVN